MPFAGVIQELEEKGFGVKVVDGGIIARLGSRKPSRHELVNAVPRLENFLMETVGEGVFISSWEEQFSV
ncbi:hypothetical protein [Salinibacter grassmerensis]|uniref:hypothetical protein n=1 Tax=Salinibacter grassmerensis TaxID=3040353 RepID=UPI0021E7B41B|nr:hypothetical protein [Salinibacter grassmerensis]